MGKLHSGNQKARRVAAISRAEALGKLAAAKNRRLQATEWIDKYGEKGSFQLFKKSVGLKDSKGKLVYFWFHNLMSVTAARELFIPIDCPLDMAARRFYVLKKTHPHASVIQENRRVEARQGMGLPSQHANESPAVLTHAEEANAEAAGVAFEPEQFAAKPEEELAFDEWGYNGIKAGRFTYETSTSLDPIVVVALRSSGTVECRWTQSSLLRTNELDELGMRAKLFLLETRIRDQLDNSTDNDEPAEALTSIPDFGSKSGIDVSASYPHYYKRVPLQPDSPLKGMPVTHIDIYAVLRMWGVNCPARQHAIKKLICTGERGAKDYHNDLKEAKDAITRAGTLAREFDL